MSSMLKIMLVLTMVIVGLVMASLFLIGDNQRAGSVFFTVCLMLLTVILSGYFLFENVYADYLVKRTTSRIVSVLPSGIKMLTFTNLFTTPPPTAGQLAVGMVSHTASAIMQAGAIGMHILVATDKGLILLIDDPLGKPKVEKSIPYQQVTELSYQSLLPRVWRIKLTEQDAQPLYFKTAYPPTLGQFVSVVSPKLKQPSLPVKDTIHSFGWRLIRAVVSAALVLLIGFIVVGASNGSVSLASIGWLLVYAIFSAVFVHGTINFSNMYSGWSRGWLGVTVLASAGFGYAAIRQLIKVFFLIRQ